MNHDLRTDIEDVGWEKASQDKEKLNPSFKLWHDKHEGSMSTGQLFVKMGTVLIIPMSIELYKWIIGFNWIFNWKNWIQSPSKYMYN